MLRYSSDTRSLSEYAENIALNAEISSSSSSDLSDINDGVAESTTGTLYTG